MTTPRTRVDDDTADLVLYDGVCGLCDRVVQFTIRRDPERRFRFAPLQEDLARQILERHDRSADQLDTFYVVRHRGTDDEAILDRARGALYLCGAVGWPWRALTVFGILPTFLLDLGYRFVARIRYRLFGRFDTCPVPSATDRDRFL